MHRMVALCSLSNTVLNIKRWRDENRLYWLFSRTGWLLWWENNYPSLLRSANAMLFSSSRKRIFQVVHTTSNNQRRSCLADTKSPLLQRPFWGYKMTPSELEANILKHKPDSHFFDQKTMKFFGDTMSNYGVRKAEINGLAVWELYRKRPVNHGVKSSAFFRTTDFQQVFWKAVMRWYTQPEAEKSSYK